MTHRMCSVDGCEEKHSGRGYCAVHYQHWYRWGDPLHYAPAGRKGCSFPDCSKPHESHGYCNSHAAQLRRGQELRPLGAPRPQREPTECSVDDCVRIAVARGLCPKHYNRQRANGHTGTKLHRKRKAGSYALNEAYFDEVTTEEQAYWLGFIAADGAIIRSGNHSYTLRVELAACDVDHLQALSGALGSGKPLRPRRNGSLMVGVFESWRIVEALERQGIGQRKSLTVEPWDGPEHLMRHWWRGLFDGDGTIFWSPAAKDWFLSLTGSRACAEGFRDWGAPLCGSRSNLVATAGGTWRWGVASTRMAQILANALYEDSTVFLARKRARADELCSIDLRARKTLRVRA